jgi:hypothetical protein
MTPRNSLYVALLGLGIAVQCAIPLLPPINNWFFHHPDSALLDDVFFCVVAAGWLFGMIVMVIGLTAAGVLAMTKRHGNPS